MQDVPYPDFLCGLQLTAHLKYVCSVVGMPAQDPSGGFTYCDLGCGQSRTASAIAAFHPDAQVWGLDLSVDHILAARAFAERATQKSAMFMAVDLANFDLLSLPPLDFISMLGVWAWVSEQLRDGIFNLVMQQLKPGALCYVSYNAMPGAVSLGAIRRMCLDLLEDGQAENLGVLLPQALKQLRSLSQADGLFFQKHPIAEPVIATAETAGLRYMAHQYLADKWEPMSIKQVAGTMRGAGLTWASSCILEHRLNAESFIQLSKKDSFGFDAADLAEVLMALVVVDVIWPLPTGSLVSYAKKPIPQGADLHPYNEAALATKRPGQSVTMIAPAFGSIVSIPSIDVDLLETHLAKDHDLDVLGLCATLAASGMSFLDHQMI
jgi:hypothetical protein